MSGEFRRVVNSDYAVRVVDRDAGVIDLVCSTENLCADGLSLQVSRWDTSQIRKNPIVTWCHTYGPRDGYDGRTVGVVRGTKKDLRGEAIGKPAYLNRIQFNGLEHAHPFAHSLGLLYMDGRMRASSAGFAFTQPEKYVETGPDGKPRQGLRPRSQVHIETALCPIGMDPDALTIDEVRSAFPSEAEARAFVAHVRSMHAAPRVLGGRLDSLPDHVRSLAAVMPEDVETVERDLGWIEDGFAWESRVPEITTTPTTPQPDAPPAPATDYEARIAALEAEIARLREGVQTTTEATIEVEGIELGEVIRNALEPRFAALERSLDDVVSDVAGLISTHNQTTQTTREPDAPAPAAPIHPADPEPPQAPRSAEGSAPPIDLRSLLAAIESSANDAARAAIQRATGYVDPRTARR